MKRLLSLSLTFSLLLSLSLRPAAAFWPFREKEPPVQTDVLVSTVVGEPYVFSPEDFSPDGETAECYLISGLPESQVGVLQIGAMLVEEGSGVARDALSGLTWYPLDDSVREISFQAAPMTGGLTGEAATVTVQFLTSENQAPEANTLTLSTYRNSPVSSTLSAEDPEGDELTYFLLSQPEQGTVTLDDPAAGAFTYTPGKKAGSFTFTWLARDCHGNRSLPATVTVTVDKEEAAVTYADLGTSSLSYDAARLAQEGIYVGPELDGQYCFYPEQVLTRSEFLVLALRAAGISPLSGDTVTGFSDDGQIPTWAKPYVAAAWQEGLINGRPGTDGQPAFCPNELITPAEAAVLLNRILPLSDVTAEVFAPASAGSWAGQAVANLCSAGLLSQGQALNSSLTRGEAARLLCGVLDRLV